MPKKYEDCQSCINYYGSDECHDCQRTQDAIHPSNFSLYEGLKKLSIVTTEEYRRFQETFDKIRDIANEIKDLADDLKNLNKRLDAIGTEICEVMESGKLEKEG